MKYYFTKLGTYVDCTGLGGGSSVGANRERDLYGDGEPCRDLEPGESGFRDRARGAWAGGGRRRTGAGAVPRRIRHLSVLAVTDEVASLVDHPRVGNARIGAVVAQLDVVAKGVDSA